MNYQFQNGNEWSAKEFAVLIHSEWQVMEGMLSNFARSMRPLVPLFIFFALKPAFGQGVVGDGGELETVTTAAESVLATMNSILRIVSIIAIMACGLGAGFGRMEWGTVGKVFMGLVVANAATTVVEYLGGGVSQT